MKVAIALIASFLCFSALALSATIYVPDNYATIQGAIDAAVNGDTIIVRPGTYVENIDFAGKEIRLKSESGPKATTIDGNQARSVVTFKTDESRTTVLDGFTITNGLSKKGGGIYLGESTDAIVTGNIISDNSSAFSGGGVYCSEFAVLTLSNNTIFGNTANDNGGGVCCNGCTVTLVKNSIFGNSSYRRGGGIYCEDAISNIDHNTIFENRSVLPGAGIGLVYSDASAVTNNTITRNASEGFGGGIYCFESDADITFNTLTGNSSDSSGGAIGYWYSSPIIAGNTISGNFSVEGGGGIDCYHYGDGFISNNIISRNRTINDGGGIRCWDSSPSIDNNRIFENVAARQGGGIYCGTRNSNESTPIIQNNAIMRNIVTYRLGGGIGCERSSPFIANNIIIRNAANIGYGGGISCIDSAKPIITNNTIVENTAYHQGGGFYCRQDCSPTITNTILWDNSAPEGTEIWLGGASNPSTLAINYSDLKGGQTSVYVGSGCELNWGPGMIDADPLFVDQAGGDLHLTHQSPCCDSGNSEIPGLTALDFEGDPRVASTDVDMGADEAYYHLYHMGKVIPGQSIDIRLIGWPGAEAKLFLGSGIKDPPLPTIFGDVFLEQPVTLIYVNVIPPSGVLDHAATVPVWWPPGEVYPFQAFVGRVYWPRSRLTNSMILAVE